MYQLSMLTDNLLSNCNEHQFIGQLMLGQVVCWLELARHKCRTAIGSELTFLVMYVVGKTWQGVALNNHRLAIEPE